MKRRKEIIREKGRGEEGKMQGKWGREKGREVASLRVQ